MEHARADHEAGIIERLRRIVSRISKIDIADLASDVRVRDELGVDSLMAMEIVANCEKELDIAIDEAELYGIETIGDFERLVVSCYLERHGQA